MANIFTDKFDPAYGRSIELTPLIRRVTANNPSPWTFKGTNTYLIGNNDNLAILDPGPDLNTHFATLIREIADAHVSHIVLTHDHGDHSALALKLAKRYRAPICAGGLRINPKAVNLRPNVPVSILTEACFTVDIILSENSQILTPTWALTTVVTKGHHPHHLSFGLEEHKILFTGDHVMAWATSLIAPPEGSMRDYMASLDKLLLRDDLIFLPGHGPAITKPQQFLRALKAHRKMRERAILEQLKLGPKTIEELVRTIYKNIHSDLHKAAGLSTYAHLLDLCERHLVTSSSVNCRLAEFSIV